MRNSLIDEKLYGNCMSCCTPQVILGVVRVARSKVESVREVSGRVREALQHLPAERLILAPDCGLGMLPTHTASQKLAVLAEVAGQF